MPLTTEPYEIKSRICLLLHKRKSQEWKKNPGTWQISFNHIWQFSSLSDYHCWISCFEKVKQTKELEQTRVRKEKAFKKNNTCAPFSNVTGHAREKGI